MKKLLLVVPLALMLGACSDTQQNTKEAGSSVETTQTSSSAKKVKVKATSQSVSQASQTEEDSSSQTFASTASSQVSSQASASSSSSQVSNQSSQNFAQAAIEKTSQATGVDAKYLYASVDGDLIQVRENHQAMVDAGMKVDPNVDPVVANYTIEDGVLTEM